MRSGRSHCVSKRLSRIFLDTFGSSRLQNLFRSDETRRVLNRRSDIQIQEQDPDWWLWIHPQDQCIYKDGERQVRCDFLQHKNHVRLCHTHENSSASTSLMPDSSLAALTSPLTYLLLIKSITLFASFESTPVGIKRSH